MPCKRGHTEGRRKNGTCLTCNRTQAAAWKAAHPEARKAINLRAMEKYLATEHGVIERALTQIKQNASRRGNR